jgi:hypothetical protein
MERPTEVRVHRLRQFFPEKPVIERNLLGLWAEQEEVFLKRFRATLYEEAIQGLEIENEARKAQGLPPLRTLMLRHYRSDR